MAAPATAREGLGARQLDADNAELRIRLQELEDTLHSIQRGDVDALVVNDDLYTLESAHAATNRMRQDVLGQMEDAVFAFDDAGHVIYLNPAAERRYGVLASDVLGCPRSVVFTETTAAACGHLPPERSALAASSQPARASTAATHLLPDGRAIHVESVVSPLSDAAGRTIGTLAVVRDVTERRRAELRSDALVRLNDRLRDLDDADAIQFQAAQVMGQTLEVSRAGYGTVEPGSEVLHITRDWTAPGVASRTGSMQLRAYGFFIDDLTQGRCIHVADVRLDPRTTGAAAALEARGTRAVVAVPLLEQATLVAVMFAVHAEVRDWTREDLLFVQEVTERTRAVSERSRSASALRLSEQRLREANETLEARVQARTAALLEAEEALRQAQKMEAVGQLTGGIAHDFNNLLAAIGTSLQVLQVRLQQGRLDGQERYIAIGQTSVRRAAALTQRLLAFARRQTLDPKPTDVNRLVAGMEDLLRRSVGPNVEMEVLGADDLWPTRIDPSQLENSLLNLCLNARDAMQPGGGRLTIATANQWLDDRAAAEQDLPPGHYVSLCVTDTGAGMTADVMKRVFDPFFTTKPLGQGTGLGLSMVYGFVRQSGGQVRIASEAGQGTTLCLYMPRHVGVALDEAAAQAPAAIAAGDGQTVLVVEDEHSIRLLIAEVLEEAGYRVVCREDGPAGLAVLQSGAHVDLLLTDVGLPGGMNGRQVADVARLQRPDLQVLFITGYAEKAAVGNGQLDPGMAVLTKPFEISALTQKVREMTAR